MYPQLFFKRISVKLKFHPCENKQQLDEQLSAITGSGGEVKDFKIDYNRKISTIYYILPIWVSKEEFNLKLTSSLVYNLITK